MIIVDAHTHIWKKMMGWRFGYLPLEQMEYGKAKKGDEIIQWVPPSFDDTTTSAEILLGYMDWVGIDKAVLLQAPCYGDQNEYVHSTVAKYPERFAGIGFVDPRKKQEAADEIEYLVKQYKFKGVKFEIPDVPFYMDEKEYECIWEKITQLDAIAVIDLGWGSGPYDYNLDRLRNVLVRFPELKVVLCHLGVSKLWDTNQKYPFNTLQTTLKLLDVHPDKLWFDIAGLQFFNEEEEYPYPRVQEILKAVKESIGIDRILWGTDFPTVLQLCTYKQCLDLILKHCDFLSLDEKRQILGENSLKVYFC